MNIEEKLEELVPKSLIEDIKKDRTFEEYFNITDGKKRNLLVNLTKYLIESGKSLSDIIFTLEEIEKNILFKELDRKVYLDIFFKKDGENYRLNDSKIEKLKEWIDKNKDNKISSKEEILKNIYFELENMLTSGNMDYETFNKLIAQGIDLAKELHWKYLPIYDEQMIANRRCLPENISNYYNHYHAIEDLYEYVFNINRIELKKKNGDETLNRKLNFKVYTARWNGYDSYTVQRKIYGWDVDHSPSTKDGEGSLFDNLNHDSVFYPQKGISFALENLWKLADDGEIDFQELQRRLQEIADWISDVERNLRKKQPEWCNYY